MKNLVLFTAMAMATVLSAPAKADHASGNAGSISQLSYRLADTAESLERYAQMDGGWNGPGPLSVNKSEDQVERDQQQPLDHRGENLWSLSLVARRLHLAASELYRAARWNGESVEPFSAVEKSDEGGSQIQDHRGDGIRNVYNRVRSEYQNLQIYYRNLSPYAIDPNIHYLVRDIDTAYRNLEWYVYGVRI